MNKIIAYLISGTTLVLGIVILCFMSNSNGAEGVLFILGFLGMPMTLLGGMGSPYIAAFLYFVQYQFVAFLVYKWVRSSFISCLILVIILGYFSLILTPLFMSRINYHNEIDQRIAQYNKALESNPNDYEAYYHRGANYDDKKDYDHAISDYSKSININPRFGIVYDLRAHDYYLKQEYDKAWEDMNKAESLGYKVDPSFVNDLKGHLRK